MRIENEFTVTADASAVYDLMLDVRRVAPCIPGAELIGTREDGSFDARMTMKMGPMSLAYTGTLGIVEQDRVGRRAVLSARGSEQRGQGNAKATMTMTVDPVDGGGTAVRVVTDLSVTGRVAQMGRGVMQDVAGRMMAETAACIEARLAPVPSTGAAPEAPTAGSRPVRGLSLLARVLLGRLRALVTRRRGR